MSNHIKVVQRVALSPKRGGVMAKFNFFISNLGHNGDEGSSVIYVPEFIFEVSFPKTINFLFFFTDTTLYNFITKREVYFHSSIS